MGFIVGLLTTLLVVDCIILIMLVIVQLPKKDAGAGMAFGSGTADALFGAGSGTVLTQITKYSIGILFALALLIAIVQKPRGASNFVKDVENPSTAPMRSAPAQTAPPAAAAPAMVNTNSLLLSAPMTNSPIVPAAQ